MRGDDGKLPPYPTMDLRELAHHLYMVTNDLIDTHDELVMVEKGEMSARLNGYMSSGATTDRGREMDGKRDAMVHSLSVVELRAQVEMLTNEKFLILKIIDLRLAGVL